MIDTRYVVYVIFNNLDLQRDVRIYYLQNILLIIQVILPYIF